MFTDKQKNDLLIGAQDILSHKAKQVLNFLPDMPAPWSFLADQIIYDGMNFIVSAWGKVVGEDQHHLIGIRVDKLDDVDNFQEKETPDA